MSETINPYEKFEKKLNLQELKPLEENIESFTINAEEAAQILGVNRSRLSQLTSKGIFTFERRKIDTRNRLFYKLSDLLNHQRSQIQGYNHHTNPYYTEKTFKLDSQELKTQPNPPSIEEKQRNFIKIFHKNKNHFQNKNLTSAKDIHLKEFARNESIEIKKNILFIKESLLHQEEALEKIRLYNAKKENILIKHIKENNDSITNTQYSISLLNKEIKKINDTNQFIRSKSITERKIKSLWKKKKAKYTPKLTTGS